MPIEISGAQTPRQTRVSRSQLSASNARPATSSELTPRPKSESNLREPQAVPRLTTSEIYKEPGNGSSLRNAARMQRSLQVQSGGRGAFPISLASDVAVPEHLTVFHTSYWCQTSPLLIKNGISEFAFVEFQNASIAENVMTIVKKITTIAEKITTIAEDLVKHRQEVYNRSSGAAETINKEKEPSARRAVSALRLYLCNQQQADLTTIRRHSADKNAERPDEQESLLKIILPMTNQ
ncbi:uncharacterized protein PG998_013190 [Apiospora kogelbergensis]|uniref:uncharacterized protein n=1 Tax=Apiospora kogelbergensis TaxID=1337665 RepID=UPI00312CE946